MPASFKNKHPVEATPVRRSLRIQQVKSSTNVKASAPNVKASAPKVKASASKVKASASKVKASASNVKASAADVKASASNVKVSSKQMRIDAVTKVLQEIKGPALEELMGCGMLKRYIETSDIEFGLGMKDLAAFRGPSFCREVESLCAIKMRLRHTPNNKWEYHDSDDSDEYDPVSDLADFDDAAPVEYDSRSDEKRRADRATWATWTSVTVRSITVGAARKTMIKLKSNIPMLKTGTPLHRELFNILGFGHHKPFSFWFLLTFAHDRDGNIPEDMSKFLRGSNFIVSGCDVLDLANKGLTAFLDAVQETNFPEDIFGLPRFASYTDPVYWKMQVLDAADKVLALVKHLQICYTDRYKDGGGDDGKLDKMFPGLELESSRKLIKDCLACGGSSPLRWWSLFPTSFDNWSDGEGIFGEVWSAVYGSLGRQTRCLYREHPTTHLCGPQGELLHGKSKHGGALLPREIV
jgi:hypothetical protein